MSAVDTRSSARSDASRAGGSAAGAESGTGVATRHLVRMRYMPGLDGPELDAVYARGAAWLDGKPLEMPS